MTGRWRFVWSTWAVLGGALGGFGIALLLQQFAVYPLSLGPLILGAFLGVAAGAASPSIVHAILAPPPEART